MRDGEAAGESELDEVALTWSGEVDLDTVHGLREELMSTLRTRPHAVLIDLGEVTFIDSAGVGVLLAGWKHARSQGVRLTTSQPLGQVRRVLEQMGLIELLVTRSKD